MSDVQRILEAQDDGDELPSVRALIDNKHFPHPPKLPTFDDNTKDTNPKDAAAIARLAWSVLPLRALAGPALALQEGAWKYGRHNYRVAGVKASVYFDAFCRHTFAWWEGEDIDPKSQLHHLDKAIAGLIVYRDAMLEGLATDDRPPAAEPGWIEDGTAATEKLFERMREEFGPSKPPFTESGR